MGRCGDPNKGLEFLLGALAQLPDDVCLRVLDKPPLDIAADAPGRGPQAAGAGGLFAGKVPRAELEQLLRSTTALIVPSLFEGFGLPAVEALACGTPVIASRAGALAEVVARAQAPGTLVPPADLEWRWRGPSRTLLADWEAQQAQRRRRTRPHRGGIRLAPGRAEHRRRLPAGTGGSPCASLISTATCRPCSRPDSIAIPSSSTTACARSPTSCCARSRTNACSTPPRASATDGQNLAEMGLRVLERGTVRDLERAQAAGRREGRLEGLRQQDHSRCAPGPSACRSRRAPSGRPTARDLSITSTIPRPASRRWRA